MQKSSKISLNIIILKHDYGTQIEGSSYSGFFAKEIIKENYK